MAARATNRPAAGRRRIYLIVALLCAMASVAMVSASWPTAYRAGVYGLLAASTVALLIWRPRRPTPRKSRDAARPRTPAAPQQSQLPLFERLLADGRYALLLHPEIRDDLTPEQGSAALELLCRDMAASPGGEVRVKRFGREQDPPEAMLESSDDIYIDRCAVTNAQFLRFVEAGGYRDRTFWRPEIWPVVGNFLDATGIPGPRYWEDGAPLEGDEELPVVGVSWYEADAYARWVGKRLPSDAEWLRACVSPVRVAAGSLVQRRFPWGDALDASKANVWSSHRGSLAPAADYASGGTLQGVLQMIGNVWEWTLDEFGPRPDGRTALTLPTPMKSIRGGAYDTYFDAHAAADFQSGENPLARKHNIGFRCVLCVSELSGQQDQDQTPGDAECESRTAGEGASQRELAREHSTTEACV